jgi:hypothetical protein
MTTGTSLIAAGSVVLLLMVTHYWVYRWTGYSLIGCLLIWVADTALLTRYMWWLGPVDGYRRWRNFMTLVKNVELIPEILRSLTLAAKAMEEDGVHPDAFNAVLDEYNRIRCGQGDIREAAKCRKWAMRP